MLAKGYAYGHFGVAHLKGTWFDSDVHIYLLDASTLLGHSQALRVVLLLLCVSYTVVLFLS